DVYKRQERKEDIPLLINHFLKKCAIIDNRTIQTISPSAMEALESFDWPGNVRQLINTIEYALMTAKDSVIKFTDLPEYIFSKSRGQLIITKKDERRQGIIDALTKHKWNRSLASRHLGISRVTLWKLMKEYGIESERSKLN
ncbi:MAG: sigma-54-dependent Fis family transcriptional regulator, partial [Thermodesulfovibrionales bacterium]|nr:sigma-54-dependent Fis family transcriptional regulator [Thermodesulfovibrionales bacterium]